jgi:DNA-binding MarR family transcriptional regulator
MVAGCKWFTDTDAVATSRASSSRTAVADVEIDALLAASRILVGISARSIAAVADIVDITQFRVLVILASRGSASLGTVAETAGLHQSTASRLCDRMVTMGLIDRADDPVDRRQLMLTLTRQGRDLVRRVMTRRRAALESVLARMLKPQRAELISALRGFAAAAGEPSDCDLWAMGWTT